MVENHNFSTNLLNDKLDEFKSESAKSISVGNHNFELMSLPTSFQYGFKSFSFVVKSGANIFDDFCSWESFLEIFGLSSEVWFLL